MDARSTPLYGAARRMDATPIRVHRLPPPALLLSVQAAAPAVSVTMRRTAARLAAESFCRAHPAAMQASSGRARRLPTLLVLLIAPGITTAAEDGGGYDS